jgi:hypothetical protein
LCQEKSHLQKLTINSITNIARKLKSWIVNSLARPNPRPPKRLPRIPPTLRLQTDNFQPAPRSQLPPPAYNFGVPAGTHLEGGYPIMPGKGYESPAAHYYKQRRYNKRRIICFVIAILVMLIIALTIFGAVFHWGNSRFCVRWNDGTTSGDCSANN